MVRLRLTRPKIWGTGPRYRYVEDATKFRLEGERTVPCIWADSGERASRVLIIMAWTMRTEKSPAICGEKNDVLGAAFNKEKILIHTKVLIHTFIIALLLRTEPLNVPRFVSTVKGL